VGLPFEKREKSPPVERKSCRYEDEKMSEKREGRRYSSVEKNEGPKKGKRNCACLILRGTKKALAKNALAQKDSCKEKKGVDKVHAWVASKGGKGTRSLGVEKKKVPARVRKEKKKKPAVWGRKRRWIMALGEVGEIC